MRKILFLCAHVTLITSSRFMTRSGVADQKMENDVLSLRWLSDIGLTCSAIFAVFSARMTRKSNHSHGSR